MGKKTFLPVVFAVWSLSTLAVDSLADAPAPATGKVKLRPVTAQDARNYFLKQDWAQAATAYEQLLRANPHDGQHWHNYGFVLHSLKRYDEAIQAAAKALELGYQPEWADRGCHGL